MKKCLILVSAFLLSNVNMFAQMQKEVQKQVTGAVKCENYSLGSDCYCHRYMYQQKIKGKATYTAKGAPSYAMIEAKQRECMHAYNPHYSGASEYEKKLKQIPMSLIPAEEQSKGNIQAQYLFNQETEAAFRDPKVNNTEKADEFLDKNIEILIANMINKGWAAKNIMKHLYAGNLTTEQKEAALQTLNANLPNVGKCKSDICKVPGTVGDVAELFANCGEDACLLTALHVELFNSLVQSGAKSVTTDQALKLLTNMLVKNVGDANGKSKRFGDKQANATVKIPVLKAILELGDEDYYLKTTKKVLDKKTMSYSDSDTEVMSFIIDSYSAMDRYDPLIEMALNQTKNQVAKIEAAIALAGSDHPEILTDEEKQKIANILHYSYASETTACPEYYNDTRLGGSPVLAGPVNTTETDVILKQRICEAYTKLGVKGINDRLPCYPCQGNLETDGQTLVAETLLSFFLDDAIDDIMFGALTFGTGVVAKHVIKGPKYINKTRRLANKVRKAVKGGNKFTDKITAGVSVPKKARKAKKAKRYTLTKSSNGKTVAIWESPTTPNTTDVKKAATTPGTVKKGGPNVEEKINDIAARSDFGNQLQTSDVPGTNPKGTEPKGQTSSSRPVVDPNKMKEMPPTNTRRPRSAQVNKSVNTPVKPAARVEDATDVVHGAEAVEGALNRVSEPIPTLTPKKTALSPTELEPKLTGKLDDEITLAKAGGNDIPPTRIGAGFYKQELPMGQTTASGAPEGMRRQIGFGKSDTYIPDDAGKAVSGTGGVQDLRAKGNPNMTGRTPEGPVGLRTGDTPSGRNPYDVKNQAGGTPDTPGTPQQDLSGNKGINTSSPPLARNEFVDPYTTIQETLDSFDDEIAKLEAQRKKMGLFAREKKAKLDRQITELQTQRSKLFDSVKNKTLNTHSPIYDHVLLSKKADIEKYLRTIPDSGPDIIAAKKDYIDLFDDYLSVNVDALSPYERTSFLKSFDELCELRLTDAISSEIEGRVYMQKILNLRASLDNINRRGNHIIFGGEGLGLGIKGTGNYRGTMRNSAFHARKSGLRQQYFGAVFDTDTSIPLKTFKDQIDALSGPNGFKDPPLIDFSAHGYLYDSYGGARKGSPSWHGTFSGTDNTISEIVDLFNDGQQYNLYFRNCHGGAAMDDFLAMPANKTKNLNIFTEAGRNQLNPTGIPSSQNSNNSLEAAIDYISDAIGHEGKIGARAVIDGQHYYPLEEAIAQARAEGNTILAKKLDTYKTLMETSDPNEFAKAVKQYKQLFPEIISSAPSSPGFTIQTIKGQPGQYLYIDPSISKYVQQVWDNMLAQSKGRRISSPPVPKKMNPSTISSQKQAAVQPVSGKKPRMSI